ncbi:MAG: hypothetical protein CMI54_02960 [Parcubacteria group bacterium]|nr:hypothetical protein [Parcubacteria group bacterium]|tara:strand:- start:19706 stop:20518 length:813 start_codon:yes stop_codon:yes gene_type:complete
MAYSGAKYISKVMNRSGYVVELPNVDDVKNLIGTYPPDPYAESSTQLFPLGTRIIQGEREWRYCENASIALNIAAPLQGAARAHAEQDDDIVCGAAAAAGTDEVSVTSTANLDASPNNTADTFKEGYLIVNDAAGEGQMYKIRTAPALSGTDTSVFKLYDKLTIALTTSSQLGLIQNPYKNVIATAAPLTGKFAGIPLLAITADYFFWSQTKGPAPIVAKEVIALGTPVVVGVTAAKANEHNPSSTGEVIIGESLTPGVTDGESCIVDLW